MKHFLKGIMVLRVIIFRRLLRRKVCHKTT